MSPEASKLPLDQLYLVWSNEHSAWWAPNREGYTNSVGAAGLYTHKEAYEISDWTVDPNGHRSEVPKPAAPLKTLALGEDWKAVLVREDLAAAFDEGVRAAKGQVGEVTKEQPMSKDRLYLPPHYTDDDKKKILQLTIVLATAAAENGEFNPDDPEDLKRGVRKAAREARSTYAAALVFVSG